MHELRSVGGRLGGQVRIACAAGAESRPRLQEEGRGWLLKAASVGERTPGPLLVRA